MLTDLTDWVIDVIDKLGYVGVALLVALENLFPPIPSEIVLPFAGVVARRGGATLPGMIVAATIGSVVGALVLYGIAAAIGPERLRAFVVRYGRWFRLTVDDLERAERWFDRRAAGAGVGGGGGAPVPVAGLDPSRVPADAAGDVPRVHGGRQPDLEQRAGGGRLRPRRGEPLAPHRGRDGRRPVRSDRRDPGGDRLVRVAAVPVTRGPSPGPGPARRGGCRGRQGGPDRGDRTPPMRYVVTGSAGFIGHHVCEALLDRGDEVDGVDAFTDNYDPALKRANAARLARHDRYRNVELDLATADPDDLDEVLAGADAVVHLAAQPGVRWSWSDGFAVYVERNITASQRLLEAAQRTRVPRLVLASSSSVYGNASTGEPLTEDAPTRPFSPYGVTKLAMEHLASAYAANWGLSSVVLRYFTVYGPGQRPDMALHRFITAVATGEEVTVYGDGRQVRDFTYAADAAAATVAAIEADVAPTTVLNVAGGAPTSDGGPRCHWTRA